MGQTEVNEDGLTVLFEQDPTGGKWSSLTSGLYGYYIVALNSSCQLVYKNSGRISPLGKKDFFELVGKAYADGVIDEEQYLAGVLYDHVLRGLDDDHTRKTPQDHARVLIDIFLHHRFDEVPGIEKQLRKLKKKPANPANFPAPATNRLSYADDYTEREPSRVNYRDMLKHHDMLSSTKASALRNAYNSGETVQSAGKPDKCRLFEGVVYSDERCTLGISSGECYITVDDENTYYLSYHPYEPCTYVCRDNSHGSNSIFAWIHNAFAVDDTVLGFARGKTCTSITGVEYDAAMFCRLILYVIENPGEHDISEAERNSGVRAIADAKGR